MAVAEINKYISIDQRKLWNSYNYLKNRNYVKGDIIAMLAGLGHRDTEGLPFNASSLKLELLKITLTNRKA